MKKEVLIGCFAILILAGIYGMWDPENFLFPKCPFLQITGWLCPGCGSQRAIHQLLQGHVEASFQMNPLFIPALTYAVTGYIIAVFYPGNWPGIRENWFGGRAAIVAFALIMVFWLGRNIWI